MAAFRVWTTAETLLILKVFFYFWRHGYCSVYFVLTCFRSFTSCSVPTLYHWTAFWSCGLVPFYGLFMENFFGCSDFPVLNLKKDSSWLLCHMSSCCLFIPSSRPEVWETCSHLSGSLECVDDLRCHAPLLPPAVSPRVPCSFLSQRGQHRCYCIQLCCLQRKCKMWQMLCEKQQVDIQHIHLSDCRKWCVCLAFTFLSASGRSSYFHLSSRYWISELVPTCHALVER